MFDDNDIKDAVRTRYAGHATAATSCCAPAESGARSGSTCCGSDASASAALGYSPADLEELPQGADLGLGCGNPLAILELAEGETVLDLGSGGGIDCFVAAKRVGPTGRVIGVDMTPAMLDRARRNAASGGFENVEFRLGEIEHLPVADASVDVVISNCVINLVPDKRQAFADAFRVLRPGGRMSVSDIVLLGEIPIEIRDSVDAYVACLSGAILRDEYLGLLAEVGFADISVTEQRGFDLDDVVSADIVAQYEQLADVDEASLVDAASKFVSIRVQARKP